MAEQIKRKVPIQWIQTIKDDGTYEFNPDPNVYSTQKNVPSTSKIDLQSVLINGTDPTNPLSSSYATSASYATTASYVVNGGSTVDTGSFATTGSNTFKGNQTIIGSLSQGNGSTTPGNYSHAEGISTITSGSYSHAEGYVTTTTGDYSHAEGQNTISTGPHSHAEGSNTISVGTGSHAEGYVTTANGNSSHAEGYVTTANGNFSHAEGNNTIAAGLYQHVQGQYNISSSDQSAFIVGNGTGGGSSRSNLIFASGSQVQVTGSIISTAGFTGSLLGTASTASFTPNAITTASVSLNTITFTKGNGTTFPITVNTGSGGGGATPPGGSDTQIQYNNSNTFGGVSALTFNGTTITANPITATGYFIPLFALGSLTTVGADYTIYEPGVYRFTSMDSGGSKVINFPDPAGIHADGQTLIIINADTTYAGYYGSTYQPQDPSGGAIGVIGTSQADTFVNMEGIWIRTARRP